MFGTTENTNRLLARQLKKVFSEDTFGEEKLKEFVQLVNSTYNTFEEQRALDDRSKKISNIELEEMNRELQEKNDFLDTFNHGMAHDIKNHSSNIIGLISMLRKYYSRGNEGMVNSIIDKLDLSSHQLTSIVQGFLYLSRAEGKIESQYTIINKEDIIETIEIETQFLSLGKECYINYNFNLNNLFYSPHVLNIIFVNLISNSIKFSKKNEPISIEVNLSHNKDEIMLYVEDNGVGIDLKDPNNKIFELFNRADNTSMIKGTGVGLFMIKRIVARHKGTVKIESEINKGTKFFITLSLKQ